ncbi:MAG TPA: ASCH domain-containing protein, partial [Sandaracinaceae bacterium]
MLLFQKRFHDGLVSGAVTLTFRRWERPHVKVGGRYRCHPIGVLVVDRVDRVRVRDITEEDAVRAGFESRAALVAYLREAKDAPLRATTELYRIE